MLGKLHATKTMALRASLAAQIGATAALLPVSAQNGPHVEVGVKGSPSRVAPAGLKRHNQVDAIRTEAKPALDRGDYAKGEAILRRALAVDKTDAYSWVLLADACEHQGKTDAAIQAYRAMIYSQGWGSSINHDPTTIMRYILLLSRKGEWREAVAVYNDSELRNQTGRGRALVGFQFTEKMPDWPAMRAAAHFILGTYHVSYAHGPTVDQVKHLEQAIQYRPKWPEAQVAYADWMLKKGELNRAEAAYKVAQTSTYWSLQLRAKDGLRDVAYRRTHPAAGASLGAASAASVRK